MRTKRHTTEGKVTGYTLSLSGQETYDWAHRPGQSWPCSTLSGKRVWVYVDSNGLTDISINNHMSQADNVDGNELDALITDHLPADCRHLWPAWE